MVIEELSIDSTMVVEGLTGKAVLQGVNGERSSLVEGDKLHLGDLVLAEPGSLVEVSLPNGAGLQLGGSSEALLVVDHAVLDITSPEGGYAVDLSTIQQLLAICGGADESINAGLMADPVVHITG